MKEAGMRIRIEPELREAFVSACRGQALPAARVLRTFMKEYVSKCERTQGGVQTATEGASGKARPHARKPTAKPATKATRQPT
ncbi:MAG: hypothetical protein QM527_07750 [Alphaproteobacteria bacterium]|nr:hypothetical protein [Alphaproteobacteria bacterium]